MSQLQNAKHEVFARKIAKATVDPGRLVNQTKVYQEVYPAAQAEGTRASASQLMTRPEVQQRIFELINKDVPFEDLSKTLKRHLRAKKEVWVSRRDEDGRIVKDHKGLTLYRKRIEPIYDIQSKALETGMKAYRVIGSSSNGDHATDQRQVHFHFTQERTGQLLKVAEELKRLNESLNLNQSYGTVIPPKQEASD